MPFATTPDGTRLYFECHGTGTPLLLLAGQASDHREWDGVRADFAAHHCVIVLDYRGTGQSDKPSAPAYSTRGFAQDAVAVLDKLGLDRAHAERSRPVRLQHARANRHDSPQRVQQTRQRSQYRVLLLRQARRPQ